MLNLQTSLNSCSRRVIEEQPGIEFRPLEIYAPFLDLSFSLSPAAR